MSQTLSEGCSIGDDCSTITCDMNFVETPIVIGIVINDSSNSSESYMKELQKLKESKESRYFFSALNIVITARIIQAP